MSNYTKLGRVLASCYNQAAKGKGNDRHASGQPFEEQPIIWVEREFKSWQLGQAVKKIHESQRLPPDRAIEELKGAVIYLCAHIITLEK
jgi:hypothetical protein